MQLGVGVQVCLVEVPFDLHSFGLSLGVLFRCSGGDLVPGMSGRAKFVEVIHCLVDQEGFFAVLAFVVKNGLCSFFVVGLEVCVAGRVGPQSRPSMECRA